jgi:hypothetical protein
LRDDEVLTQFGQLFDELIRCGGAEAQSLVRPEIHGKWEQIERAKREQTLRELGEFRAIKEGWIELAH